jgi:ribosomal protein L11 methyltransferase
VPWLSLTLELEAVEAEALSEALLEQGAESVALEPARGQVLESPGTRMRLSALVDEGVDAGELLRAACDIASVPAPVYQISTIADEDWVRRSQAQFTPIRISPQLWIVPSWHAPPEPAALNLRLDPGLAFGTGSHPSTRLVLRFLERRLRAMAPARVLDYGCGSGILAIAAAKLGAAEVAGTDIDDQALVTAAENAEANGVRLRLAAPAALAEGIYDMVLANILAGPLIDLEPVLAARTRAGGRIALSGILEAQAREVADAYAAHFEVEISETDEGWALVEGVRR